MNHGEYANPELENDPIVQEIVGIGGQESKLAEADEDKKFTAADLFRDPEMGWISVNMCFNWFTCSTLFYALNLNAASLPLSTQLNSLALNLIEFPAYSLFFLMGCFPKIGIRRHIQCVSLIIAAICCLTSTIFGELAFCVPDDENKFKNPYVMASFILALLGKLTASLAFAMIYLFTAEMYPTAVRANAVGLGSTAARLGGACSPLILGLYGFKTWLPGFSLSFIALFAGVLSLRFPETFGKEMPNNFEDAKILYQSRYKK